MVADRTNAGDNETQMLPWLQHGPLSVSIAAGALNGCEYTVPSLFHPVKIRL